MFKDVRNYIILGLSFVVIIFILRSCSRPSEQKEADRKKQYNSAISELKGRMAHVNELQEHAIKSIAERRAKDSIVIKAQNERISVLVKQAARQRTPRVDTLILENPDLKSFVDTQTEIIQEQGIQIDTLKSALEFHARVNQDLIAIEFAEDKIEAAIQIESTRRIAELEKEGRKKERGKKGWKVVAIVGAFLGFLGGSQL